jgi:hypothetical protein
VFLFVHETRNKGQDIAELKAYIAQQETDRANRDSDNKAALAAANVRIQSLENLKQQVISQPATAPQIIHDYIPTSTPIQQTAPVTQSTLPDAPVAVLTKRNEQDLAEFGLTCSQCSTERDALKATVATQTKDIQTLTAERDKALSTANGGSIFKKTFTVLKLSACAGLGAGAGSTVKKPGSAAIGAAAGAITCSLIGR